MNLKEQRTKMLFMKLPNLEECHNMTLSYSRERKHGPKTCFASPSSGMQFNLIVNPEHIEMLLKLRLRKKSLNQIKESSKICKYSMG
jgi:hypothetical protein